MLTNGKTQNGQPIMIDADVSGGISCEILFEWVIIKLWIMQLSVKKSPVVNGSQRMLLKAFPFVDMSIK